jgi:hypothetical protein
MKKIYLLLLTLSFIIFLSSNFSNLSYNDRVNLAIAYYKVAQYYFSTGDTKKGNDFLKVAKYLDPVNYNKPLPQKEELKKYTKDDFINLIFNVKDLILSKKNENIENFISFPCYKLTNQFQILEKDQFIETLEYVFNETTNLIPQNRDNFTVFSYNELTEQYNFIPLIYEENDIFVFIKNEKKNLLFILRGFGPNYKIVGINF